jgi:hypothetical protein
MATINFGNASPTEDVPIGLKHAAIHVQPVTLDTPSMTPEEASPADEHAMAGKQIFSMERPDDKARELAAKLILEEQVRSFSMLRKELESYEVYMVSWHQNHAYDQARWRLLD